MGTTVLRWTPNVTRRVTDMLQTCYRYVTSMLQTCYRSVTENCSTGKIISRQGVAQTRAGRSSDREGCGPTHMWNDETGERDFQEEQLYFQMCSAGWDSKSYQPANFTRGWLCARSGHTVYCPWLPEAKSFLLLYL